MEAETLVLTYELASAIFKYDPDTGEFFRIARNGLRKTGYVKDGYLRLGLHGKKYLAHRVAFLLAAGSMPDGLVDHIDGDTLNNRFSNLRVVDRMGNGRNMARSRANTSGLMGVSWRKDTEVWRATIRHGRVISLQSDGTLFDAACARKSAEIYYGYHENHGRHHS